MVISDDVVFMGNYKGIILGLVCLLLVGCGMRGGQYTLADLEAEYNLAQDAIAHAEQLNAKQHAPRLLRLAKERLQKVRDKQLAAPSADIVRQYQYVQTLANRAALNSLNQQVSSVRQDLQQRPDKVTVDTSALQQKITSLEQQLSDNSRSIDSLADQNQRQSARLTSLEDTVARISQLRSELSRIRLRLTRAPPTRFGDTLTRLLNNMRRHHEVIDHLCKNVRTLSQQLAAHRERIGRTTRDRESGYVYPATEAGLVAYWPFENGKGGHFEDVAGNLSVGRTVGSMQKTSGIFGSRGISFRRSGSLVGISDHPDLDPGQGDGFAVSAWFNSSSVNKQSYLLNKWNAPNSIGWYLSLSPQGLKFTMQSGRGSLTARSTGEYLDGEWHHVAVVYDAGGSDAGLKLYVDGVLKDQSAGQVSLDTGQYLSIGGSAQEPGTFFTGKLDEIRIYKKPLSKRKVKSLAVQSDVPVTAVCDFDGRDRPSPESRDRRARTTQAPDTGLIAHWPLDGRNDTWALDRVGQADGRMLGIEAAVPGRVRRAVKFRGDTSRIRITEKTGFDDLQSLTVTAWIRPTRFARQYILTKGIPEDGAMASPYGLFLTETQDIVFSVNTTEGFNQIRKVGYDRNEWIFIAGTYDGNSMTLYVNGRKVSEISVDGRLKMNDLPIFLGSRYGAFGGIRGRLDDVRIYNYALSGDEIKRLPGL